MHIWLIQDTSRQDPLIQQEIDAVKEIGGVFGTFGIPYFTNEITGLDQYLVSLEDTFCLRGSVKMVKLINEMRSINNVILNSNQYFDQFTEQIKRGLFYWESNFTQGTTATSHLPVLNNDATITPFAYLCEHVAVNRSFIKPASDLKAFPAVIAEPGETVLDALSRVTHDSIDPLEPVLVSSYKEVDDEFRFFVIGDQVITGSQYRANNTTKYVALNNSALHKEMIAFAKEVAPLYSPAEVFTLDVCKSLHGNAIVEYNCFNASGLYASDAAKLFSSIQEIF